MKTIGATPLVVLLAVAIITSVAGDCETQSATLVGTQSIMDEYTALGATIQSEVSGNIMSFCKILDRECSINVEAYSESLQSVCVQEGGQIFTRDVEASCTGTDALNIPGGFKIFVYNVPGCLGKDCTEPLPEALEQEIEAAVQDVADEVAVALGVQCTASTVGASNSSSATSWTTTCVAIGTVFFVSCLM